MVARGLEAKDLPWDPWELSVLDVVGTSIDEKGMSRLPDILKKEILKKEAGNAIRQLRDKSICNFACAAESVVNELMRLRQEVKLKTIDTEKAA